MGAPPDTDGLCGRVFLFGPYRVDVDDRLLSRDGAPIPLSPKEFDTLVALAEGAGRLVEKDRLLARVWPDAFVGDSSLARNISVLRKTLGNDLIQTVPKLGYRLATAVTSGSAQLPSVTFEPPIQAQQAGTNERSWFAARRTWLAAAAVLAACALLAFLIAEIRPHPKDAAQRGASPVRIAVLPFVNLTGDQTKEYLCDGMTEEMITVLGKMGAGRLGVIARTSAMTFKNSNRTAAEIGRSLNVHYLLECSVREATNRLHVNAQLIRTRDQVHVWAQEYDRDMRDVIRIQAEVARTIADEIRIQLPAAERDRQQVAAAAVNPKAYQAYLLGRFFWNKRTVEGTRAAIGYFEQALLEDPNYAAAYSGLADSYITRLPDHPRVLPDPVYQKAKINAMTALKLDDSLAEAHTSLALLEYLADNQAAAEKEFRRALELDPTYANAHHWYAIFLGHTASRRQEAIVEFHKALESDPLSVPIHCNAAMGYCNMRQYGKALELLQHALTLDASSIFVHGSLGNVYAYLGKHGDSAAEFQRAAELTGTPSDYSLAAAHESALAGDKLGAARMLTQTLAQAQREGITLSAYSTASTYTVLGQNERAFHWLDRALRGREVSVADAEAEPNFQSLRSDQRWVTIRKRFGGQN